MGPALDSIEGRVHAFRRNWSVHRQSGRSKLRGLLTVVIVLLWLLSALVGCGESESSESTVPSEPTAPRVTPFDNVAQDVLGSDFMIWNDRPGVAVFDYDRDGDHDIYITSDVGHTNFLYDNSGDGTLVDVAAKAGVAATSTNSSGVMACDINNDGYQDLYVGALGVIGDDLDFRSATGSDEQARELRQAVTDRLFLNRQDGTFEDITEAAFGDSANIRSTASIGCADVDSDGWLDLYVGNLGDPDFRTFNSPSHPGHYNVLYLNQRDLTFREMAESAGVRGTQIVMRGYDGQPVMFEDSETGETFQGYDPSDMDRWGQSGRRTHGPDPLGRLLRLRRRSRPRPLGSRRWQPAPRVPQRFHARQPCFHPGGCRNGYRRRRRVDGVRIRRLRWRLRPGRVRHQHGLPPRHEASQGGGFRHLRVSHPVRMGQLFSLLAEERRRSR